MAGQVLLPVLAVGVFLDDRVLDREGPAVVLLGLGGLASFQDHGDVHMGGRLEVSLPWKLREAIGERAADLQTGTVGALGVLEASFHLERPAQILPSQADGLAEGGSARMGLGQLLRELQHLVPGLLGLVSTSGILPQRCQVLLASEQLVGQAQLVGLSGVQALGDVQGLLQERLGLGRAAGRQQKPAELGRADAEKRLLVLLGLLQSLVEEIAGTAQQEDGLTAPPRMGQQPGQAAASARELQPAGGGAGVGRHEELEGLDGATVGISRLGRPPLLVELEGQLAAECGQVADDLGSAGSFAIELLEERDRLPLRAILGLVVAELALDESHAAVGARGFQANGRHPAVDLQEPPVEGERRVEHVLAQRVHAGLVDEVLGSDAQEHLLDGVARLAPVRVRTLALAIGLVALAEQGQPRGVLLHRDQRRRAEDDQQE